MNDDMDIPDFNDNTMPDAGPSPSWDEGHQAVDLSLISVGGPSTFLSDLAQDGSPGIPSMEDAKDKLAFSSDDIKLPWDNKPAEADSPVVGEPDADTQYWQPQTTEFTCAVQAQRGIIEAFTGQSISESQLVYDATVNGWLTNEGMSPHDAGNLLELYGIPCHAETGASVEDLMAELAQGHKVIVGVDSGEIWRNDFPLEDFFEQSADHAIWITGVDMTDPDNPKVTVNDSGDPDGAGKTYDLALFKDAWADSGFFYVATDEAPSNAGMFAASGFDSEKGVFAGVADWLTAKGADLWGYLNSDEGQNDVREVTETTAGIAGMIIAANTLVDASSEMLSANSSDDLFRMI